MSVLELSKCTVVRLLFRSSDLEIGPIVAALRGFRSRPRIAWRDGYIPILNSEALWIARTCAFCLDDDAVFRLRQHTRQTIVGEAAIDQHRTIYHSSPRLHTTLYVCASVGTTSRHAFTRLRTLFGCVMNGTELSRPFLVSLRCCTGTDAERMLDRHIKENTISERNSSFTAHSSFHCFSVKLFSLFSSSASNFNSYYHHHCWAAK